MSLDLAPRNEFARAVSGYAMVASAAASWGTWSLFLRNAERSEGARLAPAFEALVLFAVTALVLVPGTRKERGARSARPRVAWFLLAAFGVGDALNCLCFFGAMQRTSVAVAVLSHYLAPVFVTLAAPRVLGERAQRTTGGALALAGCGLVLLMEPWKSSLHGVVPGAGLGAASAAFYAANLLATKRLTRWFTSRELLGYHAVPAALVLVPFVPRESWAIAPRAASLLFAGSLLPGVVAGLLFVRGLSSVPASRASVLTLLEPLVAVSIGALVWNEWPGPLAAIGGGLIVAAAYVVLSGGSRRESA